MINDKKMKKWGDIFHETVTNPTSPYLKLYDYPYLKFFFLDKLLQKFCTKYQNDIRKENFDLTQKQDRKNMTLTSHMLFNTLSQLMTEPHIFTWQPKKCALILSATQALTHVYI